jgi:putative NADH-flavin reductase
VPKSADANEPSQLTPLLAGHEVVISAMRFESSAFATSR